MEQRAEVGLAVIESLTGEAQADIADHRVGQVFQQVDLFLAELSLFTVDDAKGTQGHVVVEVQGNAQVGADVEGGATGVVGKARIFFGIAHL